MMAKAMPPRMMSTTSFFMRSLLEDGRPNDTGAVVFAVHIVARSAKLEP